MSWTTAPGYVMLFPYIPFGLWGQWRRRKKLNLSRPRVPLAQWMDRHGCAGRWDPDVCVKVLAAIELACVEAQRILPTDRFDLELRFPTRFVRDQCLGEVLGCIQDELADRLGRLEEPRSMDELEKMSVVELLDCIQRQVGRAKGESPGVTPA